MSSVPPEEFVRSELVLPRHANHYGTLFGPEALSWLGQNAYLAAAQFCAQDIVMKAVTRVEFLAPVPVGTLVRLHSRVTRLGRTSMTVEVHARRDGPVDAAGTTRGASVELLSASFEMVAVDKTGKPSRIVPIHTSIPTSGDTP